MLEIFLWICLVVGVLYGLDLLFLTMEAQGWLYYRKVKRQGSASPGVLDVSSVFDPSARHGVEAQQERAGEEDEDAGEGGGRRKASDRVA